MIISINNPVESTWIFIAIFLLAILISARPKISAGLFPPSLTQQLKGLAILAIVFSHIGYFLFTDHRFLFPLSVLAGVGVDLFLFLSGLGLTISALKSSPNSWSIYLKKIFCTIGSLGQNEYCWKKTLGEFPIWQFYIRRLPKLFIPFWLILIIYLLLDFFLLEVTYSWQYLASSAAGFFTTADVISDLNSPLWYFTLILFYYLIFPWVFSKTKPWLSAIAIYLITFLIVRQDPIWLKEVIHLYRVHLMAFPLGILAGWLFFQPAFFNVNFSPNWPLLTKKIGEITNSGVLNQLKRKTGRLLYYSLIIATLIFIGYFAYYSGVGQDPEREQFISIMTMLAIIFLFSYLKIEFRLLALFGLYSYEIYLLHWPLVSRYDLFYSYLPAWLATVFYLILFLGLSWFLNKTAVSIMDVFKIKNKNCNF